jgi:hypothetical protein
MRVFFYSDPMKKFFFKKYNIFFAAIKKPIIFAQNIQTVID